MNDPVVILEYWPSKWRNGIVLILGLVLILGGVFGLMDQAQGGRLFLATAAIVLVFATLGVFIVRQMIDRPASEVADTMRQHWEQHQ